ncbi:MAG: cytochrome c, partial [Gammaproteobacteria bacterium]|nr:cytochrome c [Gammaproteobacteria bacterium]
VRDASISKAALDISVPDELDNAERIRRGAGNYAAMCATCHLTPGQESSEMFAGLYPQPPRFYLDEVIEEKRAFWVVKHGLKMTGMPAWGGSNTDDDIWSLVAFLRAMPEIEPDHYRTLVAKSDGHTHGKEKAAQMSHDNGDGHHDAEATKKMDDHNSDGHSH